MTRHPRLYHLRNSTRELEYSGYSGHVDTNSRTGGAAIVRTQRTVQLQQALHRQVLVFLLCWRGCRSPWTRELARLRVIHLLDTVDVCLPLLEVQRSTFKVRLWGNLGAGESWSGEHVLVCVGLDPVLWWVSSLIYVSMIWGRLRFNTYHDVIL